MRINRSTVLILTSETEFAREITVHWPNDGAGLSAIIPHFVIVRQDLFRDRQNSDCDLVIADGSSIEAFGERDESTGEKSSPRSNSCSDQDLKEILLAIGIPVILIHPGPSLDCWQAYGLIIELPRVPQVWPIFAGMLGREMLRRVEADSRSCALEKASALAESEATLGRYMVEMRTNINNALTTVLGNAELIVTEPGLPGDVQAQADTIRNMALRLHEVFQRFSSLEKELSANARESNKKKAQSAVASR